MPCVEQGCAVIQCSEGFDSNAAAPPPLCPSGTMEGGRQTEVSKAILSRKDVPYVVAAPLLIQVGECFAPVFENISLQVVV